MRLLTLNYKAKHPKITCEGTRVRWLQRHFKLNETIIPRPNFSDQHNCLVVVLNPAGSFAAYVLSTSQLELTNTLVCDHGVEADKLTYHHQLTPEERTHLRSFLKRTPAAPAALRSDY